MLGWDAEPLKRAIGNQRMHVGWHLKSLQEGVGSRTFKKKGSAGFVVRSLNIYEEGSPRPVLPRGKVAGTAEDTQSHTRVNPPPSPKLGREVVRKDFLTHSSPNLRMPQFGNTIEHCNASEV